MSALATRWHLLRHARPLVAQGICYGQSDMPADTQATQQAAQSFVEYLYGLQGQNALSAAPHVLLQCSPLRRCQQLAQVLGPLLQARGMQVATQTEPHIAELDFGAWEGQPWSSISPAQWLAWTSDFAHYQPGGGESTAALLRRVRLAAQTAQQLLARQPHTQIVWVTHAGVMRALHWMQHHPTLDAPQQASQWPQDGACGYGQWLTEPQTP